MADKSHISIDVPMQTLSYKNNFDETDRRSARSIEMAGEDAKPLFESEIINTNRPPLAGPETELDDDIPDRRTPFAPGPRHGVDDGFFSTRIGDDEEAPPHSPDPNGGVPTLRKPFPKSPTTEREMVDIGGVMTPVPEMNVYQQRKTIAQGMMDIALLSANANQLRYVIESYPRHPYYWFSLTFISCSLIVQIIVGILLIINGRYNVDDKAERCKAHKINNITVIGIFLITIVNVFISSFGVPTAEAIPTPPPVAG